MAVDLLTSAQVARIKGRSEAVHKLTLGTICYQGRKQWRVEVAYPGEIISTDTPNGTIGYALDAAKQAIRDRDALLADRAELARRLSEAEAELAGLREIATSGPSTASGPSPLSHRKAKASADVAISYSETITTRLATIEAAARIFFASDSWCYAPRKHDDSARACPCGYAQLRAAFGPAAPMEDAR